MKILIGYEKFGRVRDEFLKRGHDAYSNDVERDQSGGQHLGRHLQMDFWQAYNSSRWDMVIAFPPCTFVCNSGLHWNKKDPHREVLTEAWTQNFRNLISIYTHDNVKLVVENPIGALSRVRKPTQIIQPWWYGDDASKATCLWEFGVPQLPEPPKPKWGGSPNVLITYTMSQQYHVWASMQKPPPAHPRMVEWPKGSGEYKPRWGNQTDSGQNKLGPSTTRAAERGKTYSGVARIMAETWG